MKNRKNLAWVVLHTGLMVAVIANLLSGLRIATLSHPSLLSFTALLPQGDMHRLHLFGAVILLTCVMAFVAYLRVMGRHKSRVVRTTYHKLVIYTGYLALCGLIITGIGMYFNWSEGKIWHFYCALVLMAYIGFHGVVHFVQYGWSALCLISFPDKAGRGYGLAFGFVAAIIAVVLYSLIGRYSYYPLSVKAVAIDTFIHIDGKADEPIWQQVPKVAVNTFGGSNFVDGQTQVRIQAVHNDIEAFFHISWDDPDKSLKHLPLLKTEQGWQIQQQGFEKFDETRFYEDKFAVILSDNCQFGAAGTAHLGPKPLHDRPANFSGKGYHYSPDETIVDLWQWKAVRTNAMILADDNFIGPPGEARAGARRYTAGYLPDGKESGAYVMNWQWYKPTTIVPKRLPKNLTDLAVFQEQNQTDSPDWVIPWFAYEPYQQNKDTLPIGTVMPSVMYRSNRIEGDRADVRAFANWDNGQWTMELSRKLNTGSGKDIRLKDGVCMWVSAFDHSQIGHTRHVKPIKLQMAAGLKGKSL